MKGTSVITSLTSSLSQLKQRMDPDNLQIITESSFIQEFFSGESTFASVNQDQFGVLNGKPFVLYHYNGLPRSNPNRIVRYASAQAIISDYGYGNDTPASAAAPVQPGPSSPCEGTASDRCLLGTYLPITGVLRTKWPTIELKWDDEAKPSLN